MLGLVICPSRLYCLMPGPWFFSFKNQELVSPAIAVVLSLPEEQ